jgi:hypothetical protein
MATKIEASRLLIYSAAAKKDRGERCDVEAGMAKLFATETAAEVTLEAMRVMGGNGYSKDFTVERLYRDAPLVVIGGGTNELQRLIIAKGLLERTSLTSAQGFIVATSAARSCSIRTTVLTGNAGGHVRQWSCRALARPTVRHHRPDQPPVLNQRHQHQRPNCSMAPVG